MRPKTNYAKGPGGHVAYQVVGDGPFDLVFVPNWATNVDVIWEQMDVAYRWANGGDLRPILSTIRVPTLVVHREGNRHIRVGHGQYLAENIPGARYVELPGADWYPFFAGDFDAVLDEVQEFLTDSRAARRRPTGSSRPSCSQTSSARPSGRRRWGTGTGVMSSTGTTR